MACGRGGRQWANSPPFQSEHEKSDEFSPYNGILAVDVPVPVDGRSHGETMSLSTTDNGLFPTVSGLLDRVGDRFAGERARWPLWLPVAFGLGIAIYFMLPFEPPGPAGLLVLAGLAVLGLASRSRPGMFLPTVAAAVVALGFVAAQWRTASVASPVLERPLASVTVEGQVVAVEPATRGPRVILDRLHVETPDLAEVPARVRIRLRAGAGAVRPGDRLRVRARLAPPPGASYPGGYDFSRVAWFQRIGAVGFALGDADIGPGRAGDGLFAGIRARIERTRVAIATRIGDGIGGASGGVAAALATGLRGGIPERVQQDMRDSGLAHLLAISGLHLGLVAGFVFAVVRGGLALSPRAALRLPLKKIAAVTALVAAAVYLLLAGVTVPTQRAFIMTAIVLLAILVNRTGISLRMVAWAALVILALRPEALLNVGFQMSFAAVIALVATYEALAGRFRMTAANSGLARRIVLYFAAVALSSLVASLATAPFAIFHFNRFAPMGLIANMLAVPVTAFWVMPLEVLSLLLMPLGLEGLVLPLLGRGVEVVLAIARIVASWPGAAVTVPQPALAGMLAIVAGGLWLCLWRARWRAAGIPLMVAGLATVGTIDTPDILVADNARLVAVRTDAGSVHISDPRAAPFVRDLWQRRMGAEAFVAFDRSAGGPDGLRCDALGCLGLAGGRIVAVVADARAFEEDCRVADILIARVPIPPSCRQPGIRIGRFDLWREGAHAVWLADDEPRIWQARTPRPPRPWMRPVQRPGR